MKYIINILNICFTAKWNVCMSRAYFLNLCLIKSMSLYNFVQYTKIIDTGKISETPIRWDVSFITIYNIYYNI